MFQSLGRMLSKIISMKMYGCYIFWGTRHIFFGARTQLTNWEILKNFTVSARLVSKWVIDNEVGLTQN